MKKKKKQATKVTKAGNRISAKKGNKEIDFIVKPTADREKQFREKYEDK